MKKAKSTEKLIKDVYTNKIHVTTNSNLDKRILANSMSTLEKVKSKKPVNSQLSIWRIIAKSKIAQITAAAVIIIAVSLFLVQQKQPGEIEKQQIIQELKSPAEITTFASLTFAYRQGEGMEMVEIIFDEAERKVSPMRTAIDQLICELEGNCEEI